MEENKTPNKSEKDIIKENMLHKINKIFPDRIDYKQDKYFLNINYYL